MTDIILVIIAIFLALIIFELKKALTYKKKFIQMIMTIYNKYKADLK